jgi:hypothetical protein
MNAAFSLTQSFSELQGAGFVGDVASQGDNRTSSRGLVSFCDLLELLFASTNDVDFGAVSRQGLVMSQ